MGTPKTPIMTSVPFSRAQVRNPDGSESGTRIDGGHNPASHPDSRAQAPHAHVPGVTNPDGTPWLPVNPEPVPITATPWDGGWIIYRSDGTRQITYDRRPPTIVVSPGMPIMGAPLTVPVRIPVPEPILVPVPVP